MCLSIVLAFSSRPPVAADGSSGENAEALIALRASVDPESLLQWRTGSDFCTWQGVKECLRGRVTKLVLEHLNLTGTLDGNSLNRLDQLRVLSFKGLHRLKVVVLSNNRISGAIPPSLVNVSRLYMLYLDNNDFTGEIPPLNQTRLRFFNVSNNRLSGVVPLTTALSQFNASSFSNNINLCGPQVQTTCNKRNTGQFTAGSSSGNPNPKPKKISKRAKIIAGSTSGGFILLLIIIICLIVIRQGRKKVTEDTFDRKGDRAYGGGVVRERGEGSGYGGAGSGNKGGKGFSWEGDGIGSLVFLGAGDQKMCYSLEDLLKASAETLGRGTMGSTYKAVMESGYIVTVKRLKDAGYPTMEEFGKQMEALGRLRHPNIVPLRAYFQAQEERLLVYDYFPNGSVFSLLHGSKSSASGKPLHWTSCLKIAEDLAAALLYIHQNCGLVHGNLKSSNVLLGSDFQSCLTDYALHFFKNPDSLEEPSFSPLFYKAPECRATGNQPTQKADVYSFGILLLELLTGKTPFHDIVREHGSDIPKWVSSIRQAETEPGDVPGSGNDASEEKLGALLSIATACVAAVPENRPVMRDVLRMIRETRADAQVSSNSSDHSPGRWSYTVQSFPREEHLSI
ncbi:hypothetical protein Nepgr_008917 [Nepenthes gracilis]|uniref:Protein kinase domain-containing protein n=1 Tax=Nepenthes gracilis TaxID=150966 RepID=A0AAD3XJP1_NEPGR|nr:hypothetical protein Nepgr_008917 [Nepenthes gracilis]